MRRSPAAWNPRPTSGPAPCQPGSSRGSPQPRGNGSAATPCDWDGYGKPKQWRCQRVELNAFTSPGLIAYIEDGLRAHGAAGKVIPPAAVIEARARDTHRELLAELVEQVAAELLDLDAITRTLAAETSTHAEIEPGDIGDALDDDPHQSWRAAVRGIITDRQDDEHGTLRTRITELLSQHTMGEETP